jgi:IclR family acetate operon transcriptional repressor
MLVSMSSIPPVQSIRRAFAVLEALADGGELGVTEVAVATGLTPSTAHRLLVTLVDCGYASQDPRSARYRLGGRVAELAARVPDRFGELRAAARPQLEALRGATGETANLVVPSDRDVIYVDQVEGTQSVRMFTEPGRRVPAHTTGAGKAILAQHDASEIARLYPGPLETPTRRTLATPAELAADLARARDRGYAVDDQEHEIGVSCIAAAIVDEKGRALGALSISGPSPRIVNADTAELGALVRQAADRVSRELRASSRPA